MSRQHEDSRGADELQEAANVAIQRAEKRKHIIRDSVNWAAAACVEATVDPLVPGHDIRRVVIDEVSPDAFRFKMALAHELRELGWPGVEVVTEW